MGSAALLFSLLYPNATIITVEPERGNFEQLTKNVAG